MMIPIGHGNYVNSREIVAIIRSDTAPAKKMRHSAEAEQMLVNATGGRKTRSHIETKRNHVILSSLQTTTLKERINEKQNPEAAKWTQV